MPSSAAKRRTPTASVGQSEAGPPAFFTTTFTSTAGLAVTNRETDDQGVGWAAANNVLWRCSSPLVTCRMPPTAQKLGNWRLGPVRRRRPLARLNEFVKPDSLFEAQLTERLGGRACRQFSKPRAISTDAGSTRERIDDLIPKRDPPPAAHASHIAAYRRPTHHRREADCGNRTWNCVVARKRAAVTRDGSGRRGLRGSCRGVGPGFTGRPRPTHRRYEGKGLCRTQSSLGAVVRPPATITR